MYIASYLEVWACSGQINLDSTWKSETRDFPGGPVVKNLPSNVGDAGLIPGRGTKIPHAVGQLSLRAPEPVRHN